MYANSDGDKFLCTYPARLPPQTVHRIVSKTLARVRKEVPKRWRCVFRSQYEIRRVHLREDDSALVILKDLITGRHVRVSVDRTGVFLKREVSQSVQARVEAEGRTSPREVQVVVERGLDATRDYWRMRDGGQFGSHPTHDDYDD